MLRLTPGQEYISRAQPKVFIYIPSSQIRIRVGIYVIGNILGCLVSIRITRDTGRRRSILVNANVIKAHRRWKGRFDAREIDIRKSVGHAKVHDDCHGLHWNDSLSDVAVGGYGSSIQSPRLDIGHRPCNPTCWSGSVIKIVRCIIFAVIPVIVEICQAGQGLLKRSSLISVEERNRIVVDFDEICVLVSFNAKGEELLLRMEPHRLTSVGLVPDVEGSKLATLRYDACHVRITGTQRGNRSFNHVKLRCRP